ncbi:MAG: hypothetical protein ACXV5U_14665, partial [Ilumatobacteraceae bacterium]
SCPPHAAQAPMAPAKVHGRVLQICDSAHVDLLRHSCLRRRFAAGILCITKALLCPGCCDVGETIL